MKKPSAKPKLVKLIHYLWSMKNLPQLVLNWQILVLAYLRLVDISSGFTLYLNNGLKFQIKHFLDAVGLKEVFLDDEYHLKPSKKSFTVIDIGANIGAFSIAVALKNSKAKIFSYEPSRSTYELLVHNIQINGLSDRIKPNQYAVWDRVAKLRLFNAGPSGLRSAFQARQEKNYEIVPTITLSKIFTENKIKTCQLLKVDCEGAEYKILESCPPSLFKKIKTIELEFHQLESSHHPEKLIALLKKHGFKVDAKYHHIENNIGYIYASR